MEKGIYLYQIRFYDEDSDARPLPILTERGLVGGTSLSNAMENLESYYGEDMIYAVDYINYFCDFENSYSCIAFDTKGNIKYPNEDDAKFPFTIKMHGGLAYED